MESYLDHASAGFELLAAYMVRWCLIEYVGDVAAYIAAYTVSKFYDLRQRKLVDGHETSTSRLSSGGAS
jgi:hypothetical protein